MKKRNTPNLEWDELDDIDAMLNDRPAKDVVSDVKNNGAQDDIAANKNVLEGGHDLNLGEKKKRRRSELIAQGLDVDVPVMGFSQRSKRLNDGEELTIDGAKALDNAEGSNIKTEFNLSLIHI